MMFKMAHQQIVCVFTVLIILLSKGSRSQQLACGRSVINSRIIGGQDASPGSWPWHVTFEYLGRIFCQGSLINNQWVLTAALCSESSYLSGSVVHLGVLSRSDFNPNEVTRTIDSFYCHKEFNYNNYNNNICLVKLSDPVNFTDYIQPVCLASENSTFYDGTTSWVTGFGSDRYGSQPTTLQEIKAPIIGNSKCSCHFTDFFFYYNNPVSENSMCAGSENGLTGTSYGDQGAALVTKKGSIWVQSGIASFTYGVNTGTPSAYTRVSQYQKWISDRLTGTEPGFVNFTSTETDNDFNYNCTTALPTATTTSPPTTTMYPPTTTMYPPTTTMYPPTTTMYPPTTTYNYPSFTYPFPSSTSATTTATTTDDSVFSSGVKLTHLMFLSVLVPFLHVFVGTGGI